MSLKNKGNRGVPDEQDDSGLFTQAMKDVSPLKSDRAETGKLRPQPSIQAREANRMHNIPDGMADPRFPEDLDSSENLVYRGAGVQHRTMRKLQRGQIDIEAELDLHGLRLTEAKTVLIDFIAHCQQLNVKCARIIHGKGNRSPENTPVIKTHLAFWLKQRSDILAYCSARPADGGTGALYVLFKRLD